MKILFIHNSSTTLIPLRGELILEAAKAGHQIAVAIPNSNSSSFEELKNQGVSIIPIQLDRTGLNPIRDIQLVFSLIKIIRIQKPDLLFLTTMKCVVYGTFAKILSGSQLKIATLITGLGYIFQKSKSLKDFFIQNLTLVMLRLAFYFHDLILFQNNDDYREFKKRNFGNKETELKTVGSGVDLKKFIETDLPNGPLTFLMASRLLYDKGIIEYLKAAEKVKASENEIQFLLAGPFDSNPRAIRKSELQPYLESRTIHYLGELSDIREGINKAHIVVLPSYREGMPRILLESLAMGRSIITTDVPGCRDLWKENQNSVELVPAQDPDALSDKMLQFVSRFKETNFENSARQLAEDFYDAKIVNQKILEMISK